MDAQEIEWDFLYHYDDDDDEQDNDNNDKAHLFICRV